MSEVFNSSVLDAINRAVQDGISTTALEVDGTPQYCIINAETREIEIPGELNIFGVESDEKSTRVYFRCPKYVGTNVDLDMTKCMVYVPYRNANGEKDQYIVADLNETEDGENVEFTWLISRKASAYMGITEFGIRAIKTAVGGTIEAEWNTTVASANVIRGMDVGLLEFSEENKDALAQALDLINQELEQTKNEMNSAIELKGQQTLATIPDDYTTAAQNALSAKTEVEDIRVGVDGMTYDTAGEAVRGQVLPLRNILTHITNINNHLPMSAWEGGTFSMSSGGAIASGYNIRTKDFIDTSKYYGVMARDDRIIRLAEFDDDGTLVAFSQPTTLIVFNPFSDRKYKIVGAYKNFTQPIDVSYTKSFFFITDKYILSEIQNELNNVFEESIDLNKSAIENIQKQIDSISSVNSIEIHVDDFSDNILSDSDVIKKIFEFTKKFSSRTIIFDKRDFHIDESVLIPSNTTIVIDGVTIKQNDKVFDTMFRSDNMDFDDQYPYGYATKLQPCNNIKLIGKNGAKIIGCDNINTDIIVDQSKDFSAWGWRGILCLFVNCKNIEIGGIHFEQPHMWTISFERCINGYVHDLSFLTTAINLDGVDCRFGCKHFLIENILGSTYDDSVALTNAVDFTRSNDSYPIDSTFIYPSEPSGSSLFPLSKDDAAIEDIQVKNVMTGGSCRSAICYSDRGGIVRNCVFDTLEDTKEVDNRVAIFKIYGGNSYIDNSIYDIRVNNIKSNNVYRPVQILNKVDNVWINKVKKQSYMNNEVVYNDGVTITNVINTQDE